MQAAGEGRGRLRRPGPGPSGGGETLLSRRAPAALATLAAVAAAAALGQALAGDDPFAALDAYEQPRFALPPWGWVAVGVAYYLAMTLTLYRLLRQLPASVHAVALVLAVMLGNEAWNVLVFGVRAPWAAFAGIVLFALLVAAAVAVARRHDRPATAALGAYLLWVVAYDVPWVLALALLN